MSELVNATTDSTFKNDVLASSALVFVDFWAPWCQPCKMIQPHLEAFAKDHADQAVSVFKLDIDSNPETPQQFGIRSIPSVLLFKAGELVETQVGGGINQATLKKMLESHA